MMSVSTALKLGRVSNLPTVWTNVLAGMALVGATFNVVVVLWLGVAASLLYVAGMFLNDAFDHKWDAEHRNERPIPRGEVTARTVFIAGFGMMAFALLFLLFGTDSPRPFVAGVVLAGLIVLYDVSHKKNPLAPLVMGLCRVAVYFMAATIVPPPFTISLYLGSAFLLCYLIMLTLLARQEARNPKLRGRVGLLIAGISLVDGLQLLALFHPWLAATSAGCFLLTLRLQRRVAGT
jgi:4-hydroxybenzoate polyprenyltransferase